MTAPMPEQQLAEIREGRYQVRSLAAADEHITALLAEVERLRSENRGHVQHIASLLTSLNREETRVAELETERDGAKAPACECSCFAADFHGADCTLSRLVVDGVEYSAAHWYRDKDGEFWAPIAHLDGSLELLCCSDSAYEPMPLAEAIAEIGPITRTGFRSSDMSIEQVRAAQAAAEPGDPS